MASEIATHQMNLPGRVATRLVKNARSGKLFLYIGLSLASLVAMVPFLWMISTSLMTRGETLNKQWLPGWPPQIGNYQEAWELAKFDQYFFNSVIIAATTITGLLIVSILSAYAFANIRFFAKNTIFTLLLMTLMIPESVLMIPNFLTINGQVFPLPLVEGGIASFKMGNDWYNMLPALSVPFMGSAFSIFLLRQFFMQIPDDLWDAARIDGCGHFRYLLTVVVPLSRPAILTVALLSFVASWNAFLWPLIATEDDTWRPIMVGLYSFRSDAGTEIQLQMAGAFITIIPMLLIYFFTQRTFIEGIATTGLKG